MRPYVLIADSSCDLTREQKEELNIEFIDQYVTLDGKELSVDSMDVQAFYNALRNKKVATTSACGIAAFQDRFEKCVKEGQDVMYLGFSSALSSTFGASVIAAEEVQKAYPEAKVYSVDTRSASLGHGLLVYLAAKKREEGYTIDQLRDYVQETIPHLIHFFTVDDLMFLKRGGRVSATAAVVGTMLGIKPLLHVDDEGRLIPIEKLRGRRASLERMVALMKKLAVKPQEQTVFISHGDNEADAQYLADLVRAEFHPKEVFVSTIGPIIGAHSGPGTVSLFFLGATRNAEACK